MTSTLHGTSPSRRLATVLAAALFGVTLAVNPVSAPKSDALVSAASGARVVRVAAGQIGVPYKWGGTTPRTGFDCSGLTKYAYGRIGKAIPRTAQQQFNAAALVNPRYVHPGDLVFFHTGRNVYHVGIWVSRGWMIDAPHTGARVSMQRIWSTTVIYKRVR